MGLCDARPLEPYVWYGMVWYVYIYIFFCGGGVMAGNFAPYVTQPFCAPRVTSFVFTLVLRFITSYFHHQPFLRSLHKTCFPYKKLFDHHHFLSNGINFFYLPSFIALSVPSIIVLPFHTLRRGSSVYFLPKCSLSLSERLDYRVSF